MTLPADDLFDIQKLEKQLSRWRGDGDKIVFTNGVFDILHLGHVDYLTKAKALGDRLVVGINSDASVRRLNKGAERPIQSEVARASLIFALKPVDAVIIFDQDTPLEIIQMFKPDVLVKGGDYDPDVEDDSAKKYIVGSKEVKANGGKVAAIPFLEGYSTTRIVEKLKKADQ